MSDEKEEVKPSGRLAILRTDAVLGLLVAVLSILIAYVGYQGAIIGAKAADFELTGERILSVANREFLDAGQNVLFDMSTYDNYYAALEVDDDAADNYYLSFSIEFLENLESADRDLFDDAYLEEMYQYADSCFVEADDMFVLGKEVGDLADQYQLVMLIFAIGLALAAWAALLEASSNMRPAFAIFSIVILLFGLILFVPLVSSAQTFPQEVAELQLICFDY